MKSKFCEISIFNCSIFWNLIFFFFYRHEISFSSYVFVVFQHCDLLGDELLECLSWRRGALLYMYCHSLTKRREWLTRKSSLLKKVKRIPHTFLIIDIYRFLKAIFSIRLRVEESKDLGLRPRPFLTSCVILNWNYCKD